MKKKPAKKDATDQRLREIMRKPKRTIAQMVIAIDKRNAENVQELLFLRARKAEYEADKARLGFLMSRHSTLEEWAKSARRVVFAFPGITDE